MVPRVDVQFANHSCQVIRADIRIYMDRFRQNSYFFARQFLAPDIRARCRIVSNQNYRQARRVGMRFSKSIHFDRHFGVHFFGYFIAADDAIYHVNR